ncbi:MAG: hypothetical protein H7338_25140 [Candidatus Sericytochromatia bacterium]|nr:hypothetical protein [Candidatus Sericytochromatia bacterium]
MPHVPPLAWQQIGRYLAASIPPCDYPALHAVSAFDSLLIIGNFLRQRSDITAAQYAEQAGRLADVLTDGQFGPRFAPVAPVAWRADEAGGSAQVTLREVATDTVVTAVFRMVGADMHVYGAYLDDASLPEPALVTARCLAELAHWEPHDQYPIWPVTGLALAFHRLHDVPDLPFEFLTESRFTCQGRGDCCQVSRWQVTTHANVLRPSLKIPWDALGETGPEFAVLTPDQQMTGNLDTFVFAPDSLGKCRALDGQACSVHKVLGWQPLSPCMQYPFIFTVTPDSVCVTASYNCHTVAENVGQPFSERTADLQQRLQPTRTRLGAIPDLVPLAPGGPSVTWAAYRLVEKRLLDILAETPLPLDKRLALGSRLMMAVLQISGDEAGRIDREQVAAAWTGPLPMWPEGSPTSADTLAQTICLSQAPDNANALLGGGRWEAWQAGQGRSLGAHLDEALLTRFLRTLLFRKIGLRQMGAAYLWGLIVWAHRVWHRDALYRAETDGLPPDHAVQLGTARRIELLHEHSERRHLLYVSDNAFGPLLTRPETWASLLIP